MEFPTLKPRRRDNSGEMRFKLETIIFLAFPIVSSAIAFQHRIDGKRKIIGLLVFELLTALFYMAWLSPSVARYHLDGQIAVPVVLLGIYLITLVIVILWRVISHKGFREGRYTIYALITLTLWSAVLLCIGLHTPCPLCGAYWFYDWMARIGLMRYPWG